MDNVVKFFPGVNLDCLPKVRVMVDVEELQAKLADWKREWEEVTEGNMESVTVNMNLLFDDLAELLGLGG